LLSKQENFEVSGFDIFATPNVNSNATVRFFNLKTNKGVVLIYPSSNLGIIPGKLFPLSFAKFQEAVNEKPQSLELKFFEVSGVRVSFEAFLFNALKNRTS